MAIKKNKILYILSFFAFHAFCQSNEKLVYSEGLAPKKGEERKSGNLLYGFVNEKGKFVIHPAFDSIGHSFNQGVAVAVKNNKSGLIDTKGKVVIAHQFAEIAAVKNRIVAVRNEAGLWGFYTLKGKKISDCQYNNFRFRDKGKIIVQKNGLWGVIDNRGNNVLPYQYRELEVSPDLRYFQANRYNLWEMKNFENKSVGSHSFDSLYPAGEGLLKYYMLGKYGLIDLEGNFITSYKYDSIGTEQSGKFLVKVWDKYGVIDRVGEEILPVKFEKVIIDEENIRAAVKNKEGKLWWGLFDGNNGKEILSPNFPFLGKSGEGLVPAMAENGIWRYIDMEGKTVIPFRFSKAGRFNEGLADVQDYMSDSMVVIDTKGNIVIPANEYELYKSNLVWIDRNNNRIWRITRKNYDKVEKLDSRYLLIKKAGKYGLLAVTDQLLVQPRYDYVSTPSKSGYIVVQLGKKWGVLNAEGKFTLPLTERFERIFDFHEGFARVTIKGLYGFIDSRGNVYISPQYPDAGYVSEGMVSVKINNKWGFVNTDEVLKVQPYYDQVWPFKNGAAVVYARGQYTLVNKEGRELISPVDNLKVTSTGKYLLIKNGKYGLLDAQGKEILPVKYELIKEVDGGYLIVNLRGLYGVLDTGNNIVIPITYKSINYDSFNKLFLCGSEKGHEQIKVDGKVKQ